MNTQAQAQTAALELTATERRQVVKGLRLLRDRHYRNYANAKDSTSETAQEQYHTYKQLDQLIDRIY